MAEAVGAFMVSAVLITLCGVTGWFEKVMNRIPVAIASALLAGVLASQAQTELFRIPLVIERGTYAFAALVVLAATAVSALIVRRQVDHLDLVEVLKARD